MIENRTSKPGYVYIITNTLNGKVYVGQTCETLERRWQKHNAGARSHKRQGKRLNHFENALLKYPPEAWSHHQQSICSSKKTLDAAEIFYIGLYESTDPNKGYNITAGGGGNHGISPANTIIISKEQLQSDIESGLEIYEMAQKYGCHRAVIGRKIRRIWGTTLLQVRKELTGESRTERTRRAIATTLSNPEHPSYGRKHTKESRARMSVAQKEWRAARRRGAAHDD